jgi:hypothetical protein
MALLSGRQQILKLIRSPKQQIVVGAELRL